MALGVEKLADRCGRSAVEIYQAIREERIVAIVRGIPLEAIIPVAEALLAGGISLMEVTCNTPGAADMIAEVSRSMADKMLIGAGTVISTDLAEQMHRSGAQYMIAPDVNPDVIRWCIERDIAVIPGAATATEILNAYRLGVRMVKIFPAGGLGISYIEQLRGPLDDVEFIAVGGVTTENVGDFIRAGCIGAGLGGSLVKKDLVASSNWAELTRLAQEARAASTLITT